MKRITIEKETEVLIGNPAKPYPSIWLETFRSILEKHSYVTSAYLLRIAYSDLNGAKGQANPVILIDIDDPEKWDMVSQSLGKAFLKLRGKNEVIDIMPFKENYVNNTIKPFYKK